MCGAVLIFLRYLLCSFTACNVLLSSFVALANFAAPQLRVLSQDATDRCLSICHSYVVFAAGVGDTEVGVERECRMRPLPVVAKLASPLRRWPGISRLAQCLTQDKR